MASGRSSSPAATLRPTGPPTPSAHAPPRQTRRLAHSRCRTLAPHSCNPPSPHRPPPMGTLRAVAASSAAGTRRRPVRPVRRTSLPDRTAGPTDSISGPARPSGCRRTCRRRLSRPCETYGFRSDKTRRRHRRRRQRLNYCCNRPRRRRPTSRSRQRATWRRRRNTIGRYSSRAHTVWRRRHIRYRDRRPPRMSAIATDRRVAAAAADSRARM